MSRVRDIIANARITLADVNANRWTDAILLVLLNEAQQDFVKRTKILRARTIVPIKINSPTINLPIDCRLITRAIYENKLLEIVSHNYLDNKIDTYNWENDKGTPTSLVYDKYNMELTRIYPIPDEPITKELYDLTSASFFNSDTIDKYGLVSFTQNLQLNDSYGIVANLASTTDSVIFNSPYGFVTDISTDNQYENLDYLGIVTALTDYTLQDNLGIVTALTDDDKDDVFNNHLGMVTSITDNLSEITLFYVKKPNKITSFDDQVEIPDIYDSALKYYVATHAFLNDNDAANYQKAEAQQNLYLASVSEATKDSQQDFTEAKHYTTSYRCI